MRSLPSSFNTNKNKIFNGSPWLLLVEIQVTDTESFYLTNSLTSITSNGDTFDPYPISIDKLVSDTLDSPFVAQLSISNITRELMAYVEQGAGLGGRVCTIQIFNVADLDDTETEKFSILNCSVDSNTIIFDISFFSLEDVNFPSATVTRNHCRWVFGDSHCGLDITNPSIYNSGVDSPCTKKVSGDFGCTFWGAREQAAVGTKTHPHRYGAFPGLPTLIRV